MINNCTHRSFCNHVEIAKVKKQKKQTIPGYF